LPEIVTLTALAAAMFAGVLPFDDARRAMWLAALWRPELLALVLLALWAQHLRPWAAPPHAIDAVATGLLLGWLPATALLVPSATDPREAARVAVLATGAALASPIGGP